MEKIQKKGKWVSHLLLESEIKVITSSPVKILSLKLAYFLFKF